MLHVTILARPPPPIAALLALATCSLLAALPAAAMLAVFAPLAVHLYRRTALS